MSPSPVRCSAYEHLLNDLAEELQDLEHDGLLRRLTAVESVDGPVVRIEGRELVSWCSNDYLGLSQHPALIEAASRAAADCGIGGRASRLLAGTTRWHLRLEERLAAWFGAESAIVFSSGYLANLGAVAALCSSQDVVLIDRLAHASLVDAARASRATLRVFRHNDMGQVASLLSQHPQARRRVIITEGVFSMEGDRAPLAELAGLADAHEAMVYVDDAHGAFVTGATGRGSPEAAGLPHARFLYMGTLGKALGCQGGFVIGPRPLVEFLRNRAKTFIYTTALAGPVAASAAAALDLLERDPSRPALLLERVRQLHERLAPVAPTPLPGPSHIVPIIVGSAERALALSRRLWDRGFWAPAIRPPTIPEGGARLRVSVTALHTQAQIDALADALRDALAEGPWIRDHAPETVR